jgi:hypothetical protein
MKVKIIIGFLLVVLALGGVFGLRWYRESQNSQKSTSSPSATESGTVATSTLQEPIVDEFEHDRDYDGVSDVKEAELGLSDKTSDTDKDGLTDFTEIEQYKTDPKNKDTDGDGYVDGYEVLNGFNPKGTGKLNP